MAKKTPAAEEKVYTIPLRGEWLKHGRIRRVNRSVNVVRSFLEKHTKADEVNISAGLNELMWIRGAKHPPGKVKVSVKVEDDVAFARLPGEAVKGKEEEKKKSKEAPKPADKSGEKKEAPEEKKVSKEEPKEVKEGSPAVKTEEKKDKKLTPEEEANQLWKEAEKKAREDK